MQRGRGNRGIGERVGNKGQKSMEGEGRKEEKRKAKRKGKQEGKIREGEEKGEGREKRESVWMGGGA